MQKMETIETRPCAPVPLTTQHVTFQLSAFQAHSLQSAFWSDEEVHHVSEKPIGGPLVWAADRNKVQQTF